ncbi:MAG: hypothetical protein RL235_1015 [Chlamydiota bacterium]|jgi:hypothetical protein
MASPVALLPLPLKRNSDYVPGFGNRQVAWCKKADSAARFMKFWAQVSAFIQSFFKQTMPFLKNFGRSCNGAFGGLGVVRMPVICTDAAKSVKTLVKGGHEGAALQRVVATALRDVADCAGTAAGSASFVLQSATGRAAGAAVRSLGQTASYLGAAKEVADLTMIVTDVKDVSRLAAKYKKAGDTVSHKILKGFQTQYLLKLIACIVSIAAFILGAVLVGFGVPATVLIGTALVATTLKIVSSQHKMTLPHAPFARV